MDKGGVVRPVGDDPAAFAARTLKGVVAPLDARLAGPVRTRTAVQRFRPQDEASTQDAVLPFHCGKGGGQSRVGVASPGK